MNKLQFKKHVLFLFALFGMVSLTLVSCGGGDESDSATDVEEVTDVEETSSSASSEALFMDADRLQEAQDELQNLPAYKGKAINVFQEYAIHATTISVEIQDPNKPENIDHLEFQNGRWSEPQPVQITGDGDMADNVFALSEMPFAEAVKVAKTWKEEATKMEEPLSNELLVVRASLDHYGEMTWSTNMIETVRSQYNITFNKDGSMAELTKN